MAITFALRGNSLTARYSTAGSTPGLLGTVASVADAGALSGGLIQLSSGGAGIHAAVYPGRGNLPTGLAVSVLLRAKWGYSGTPAATKALFSIGCGGSGANTFGHLALAHASSTGNLNVFQTSDTTSGTGIVNTSIKNAWSPTSGTYYDLVLTYDGTTGANGCTLWIDGVSVGSLTSALGWTNPRTVAAQISIILGMYNSSGSSLMDVDEFIIWDSVINPTSVALVSGTGSLNGASRTSLVDVAALDGASWTSLTADKIKIGQSQTQAGVLVPGTYDGTDRNSDPGEPNVRNNDSYKSNSTTNNKTGTMKWIMANNGG